MNFGDYCNFILDLFSELIKTQSEANKTLMLTLKGTLNVLISDF